MNANTIAWIITTYIILYFLIKWWREVGKEREEARKRFIEEMRCKKCGGMMAFGSLKYCFRCEPYGPKECYQPPSFGSACYKPYLPNEIKPMEREE